MRRIIFMFVLLVGTQLLAQENGKDAPEQASPVMAYVKAMLSNDPEGFQNAHTKVALAAYESVGGVQKAFPKFREDFMKQFKSPRFEDFRFTATKAKYATPGGSLELDGDYYTVMMNVEKRGGVGVFVEKEDGKWKITIPKYKNLDQFMKKAQEAQEETP